MIRNRQDLKAFLQADRIALKKPLKESFRMCIKHWVFPDYIWVFQKRLRMTEYYHNKRKNPIEWIIYAYNFYRYKRLSVKLGFTIPINVFDRGLAIVHIGTIVVNPNARVGKNCRIHVCTNIGTSAGSAEAPVIGDNVYIAPGVKIYGKIQIANNVAFAANSAVGKSITEEFMLYGGVPAKKIGPVDLKKLLKHI